MKKLGVQFTGSPSYIDPSAYFDGAAYNKIIIGSGTVISRSVTLLVHDYSIAFKAIGESRGLAHIIDKIEIGDNSFIGASSVILPGTHIGKNVIVGAGSVVKGNIPDGVVIAGNPAKQINTTENYGRKWLDRYDNGNGENAIS